MTNADSRLADLADELARRLAAGDQAAANRLLAENSADAVELRALLPAIRALAGGDSHPDPPPPHPEPEGLGRDLGDFRLLREIGRGGMGVVYEAEQLSLRRRVALKILPTAAALDPRALQRFRNEAQAAAGLHHPNIVPVHGVGCERGVNYLAMQFIDGPPLSEVIRSARQEAGLAEPVPPGDAPPHSALGTGSDPLAATLVPDSTLDPRPLSPRPPLPPSASTDLTTPGKSRHRAAARLIKQAAEALEYAHSLGVIHRDVKPSNLLLDSRGNVWVADFGLAHLEGDTSLTMTGDVMGTLRYMSPEQATGRRALVDHRSDVYSLGIALYELLALRPAFPQTHKAELLQAVMSEDPPRPRRLDPSIPRDLETVLLKATEKDPARRYQTAKTFAEDLGRFLDGQPILASRAGLADRSAKWVARHRGFSASAAAILVVVTLASTLSTVEIGAAYDRETKLRKDAETAATNEARQRGIADEAAERAAKNYDLARQAISRMLTHVGEEHLSRMPEFAPVRTQVLKEAAALCDDLARLNPNDPLIYEDRARVRQLLVDEVGELADRLKLIELQPQSVLARRKLARFYLGTPRMETRDYRLALEHAQVAVSLDPEDAASYVVVGWALMRLGRTTEAIAVFRRASTLKKGVDAVLQALPLALYETGDFSGALAAYEDWVKAHPSQPDRLTLAKIYQATGRYEEALAALDDQGGVAKVLDISHTWILEQRGDVLASLGRDEEAIAAWDEAIKLAPFRPFAHKRRGAAKFRLGRYAEALADLSRSLELSPGDLSALVWVPPERARTCPDPTFREGLLRLADAAVARPDAPADAWTARGRLKAEFVGLAEARPDFAEAAMRKDAGDSAVYFHALACLDSGDLSAYRNACRDYRTRFADAAPEAAGFAAWACALAPDAVDDYTPAMAAARRAVEARPQDVDAAKTLAALLYRSGRFSEAAGSLEAVLAMTEIDPVHAAYARFFLAMARARLGDAESARASFDEAARWADSATATPEARSAANLNWSRAATLALLRREAEALLPPVEALRPATSGR